VIQRKLYSLYYSDVYNVEWMTVDSERKIISMYKFVQSYSARPAHNRTKWTRTPAGVSKQG